MKDKAKIFECDVIVYCGCKGHIVFKFEDDELEIKNFEIKNYCDYHLGLIDGDERTVYDVEEFFTDQIYYAEEIIKDARTLFENNKKVSIILCKEGVNFRVEIEPYPTELVKSCKDF